MFDFSLLIGNDHIKKILNVNASFHSYLIEGEDGSGKHTLMRLIAMANLCESAQTVPCFSCSACKKFEADAHLDFKKIPSDLKVEALRDILSEMSVYPSEGRKKVYVIEDADALSVKNQNTLLKTLEEPPEFVVFILLCKSRKSLLQTVISRCLVLTMAPVVPEKMMPYLQKKYPNRDAELKQAVAASGGYIGQAEQFLQGKETELFVQCRAFAAAYLERDQMKMMDLLNKKERTAFVAFVKGLDFYFKQILSSSAHGAAADAEQRFWDQVGIKTLCRICSVLDTCVDKTQYHVNIPLWSVCTVKDLMNL